MLLLSTEITLQIHILTFSLVLTDCLSTVIRILWYQFFSHSLCVDHELAHVTRETYRNSSYFLVSVPPRICSLVCSYSSFTRNRVMFTHCLNALSDLRKKILPLRNLYPTPHVEHPLLPFRCVAFEFVLCCHICFE